MQLSADELKELYEELESFKWTTDGNIQVMKKILFVLLLDLIERTELDEHMYNIMMEQR